MMQSCVRSIQLWLLLVDSMKSGQRLARWLQRWTRLRSLVRSIFESMRSQQETKPPTAITYAPFLRVVPTVLLYLALATAAHTAGQGGPVVGWGRGAPLPDAVNRTAGTATAIAAGREHTLAIVDVAAPASPVPALAPIAMALLGKLCTCGREEAAGRV